MLVAAVFVIASYLNLVIGASKIGIRPHCSNELLCKLLTLFIEVALIGWM